jgi:hypothetical protein
MLLVGNWENFFRKYGHFENRLANKSVGFIKCLYS